MMVYRKNMNGTSRQETEVYNYVRMLLPRKVILRNDRKVLNGRELDIYIPAYGVAIEFNGLFYHSDACRSDPMYHITKSVECERKRIKLIQIMSDEWEQKKTLVMDLIKKTLGLASTVSASKCELVEISKKEGQVFLEGHHIEGDDKKATIYLALKLKRNTLAVASFKKEKDGWALCRYASRRDVEVSNGCKTLVKHFRREHTGKIEAECDRRLFSGECFREAGFKELQPTNPNVTVTKDYKKRIPLEHMKKMDEKTLQAKGYHKVYDCGNRRFLLE